MKVGQMLEKIEELDNLRADLSKLAERTQYTDDANLIEAARDVIWAYREELCMKEVK